MMTLMWLGLFAIMIMFIAVVAAFAVTFIRDAHEDDYFPEAFTPAPLADRSATPWDLHENPRRLSPLVRAKAQVAALETAVAVFELPCLAPGWARSQTTALMEAYCA